MVGYAFMRTNLWDNTTSSKQDLSPQVQCYLAIDTTFALLFGIIYRSIVRTELTMLNHSHWCRCSKINAYLYTEVDINAARALTGTALACVARASHPHMAPSLTSTQSCISFEHYEAYLPRQWNIYYEGTYLL